MSIPGKDQTPEAANGPLSPRTTADSERQLRLARVRLTISRVERPRSRYRGSWGLVRISCPYGVASPINSDSTISSPGKVMPSFRASGIFR